MKRINWTLEPHTVAKHRILRSYLQQWFAKLAGSGYLTLIYIDGFSGPGRYIEGEQGSPLVALNTLLEHSRFPTWKFTQFHFIFIEQDSDRFDSLQTEVGRLGHNRQLPANIHIQIIHNEFQLAADSLLQSGELSSTPFFAFVDPFGYKGIPMSLLVKLMAPVKGELFVNLSTDSINRFFKESSVAKPLDDLFGMKTEERISNLGDDDRAERISVLFQQQLKLQAKLDFTWKFAMQFPNGHIGYHLVYGTHHKAGLEAMKSAMWGVDPTGGYSFADRFANRLILFEKHPDTNPLASAFAEKFKGRTVSIEAVADYTLTDTPYLNTHIKTRTLAPMEARGEILVTRNRRGFTSGTLITFL